jgi:NadR type nicotinamide-nucleotide adenylyltransferase
MGLFSLEENMENKPRIIAIVGPESTGKTTLAKQLAQQLDAELVDEYAREYLENLNRPYEKDDLLAIAKKQYENEQRALQCGKPFVVCDTDLLVITVWSEVKYGEAPKEIAEIAAQQPPRFYLLTRPDLPWVADPLRENPNDREMLFTIYERLLRDMNVGFAVVDGIGDARVKKALNALIAAGVIAIEDGNNSSGNPLL